MSDQYPEVENFDRFGYVKQMGSGGLSTDSLLHFAQLLKGKKEDLFFRKFDYGSKSANQKQ